MKKALALLLTGIMALSMAACGGSGSAAPAAPAAGTERHRQRGQRVRQRLTVILLLPPKRKARSSSMAPARKTTLPQPARTSRSSMASKFSIRDFPQVKSSPRSRKKRAIRPATYGSAARQTRIMSLQAKAFLSPMRQRTQAI